MVMSSWQCWLVAAGNGGSHEDNDDHDDNCHKHDGGDGDKVFHDDIDDDNVDEYHNGEDGHYDFHDDIKNISNNLYQLAGTE